MAILSHPVYFIFEILELILFYNCIDQLIESDCIIFLLWRINIVNEVFPYLFLADLVSQDSNAHIKNILQFWLDKIYVLDHHQLR